MATTIKAHPLNVKPSGNELLDTNYSRTKSMGNLGLLNDDLLAVVIQELDQKDMLALSHTCKALYAYCWYDELWKYHVYHGSRTPERWRGSWRRTALGLDEEALVDANGKVYSDFLFRPYQLTQIDYESYIKQLDEFRIRTYDESELDEHIFESYAYKKPFVARLSKPIAAWSMQDLMEKFGDEVFRQEYMDWPLKLYSQYMNHNIDETPLYLFDCKSKAHDALKFDIPLQNVFGRDYFTLLGKERPDHQWLIVGPKRSGSSFHKDPNATSAWNSIVSGRKYWIMFPPSSPPPGVWTNDDQSEVTAPVSLAEWFHSGFYMEALESPGFCHAVTGPGDCMYVPSGWWHAVVNLDDCIAMTGNFVARPHLNEVAHFLKNKRDQISGFSKPDELYDMFDDLLHKNNPEVFETEEDGTEVIAQPKKRKTWAETTSTSQPFTFSFNLDAE